MKGSFLALKLEGAAAKLFLCVLALCLLNGCEQFTSQSNQKDVSEQSDAVAQPSFSASPTLYAVYSQLERSLLDRALPPPPLASFEAFISDDAKSSQVESLLKEATHSDESRSENAFRALYAVLIGAEPEEDLLFDYLSNSLKQILAGVSDSPKMRTRLYAWSISYLLDSALTAYEGTNQVRFLDISRVAMLEMLKNRDDVHHLQDNVRGRVLKAWGSNHFNNGKTYTSVVTYAGRIVMPMARYAWIVNQTHGLSSDHHEAANILLDAARDALLEYEDEFMVLEDKGIGLRPRRWQSY